MVYNIIIYVYIVTVDSHINDNSISLECGCDHKRRGGYEKLIGQQPIRNEHIVKALHYLHVYTSIVHVNVDNISQTVE